MGRRTAGSPFPRDWGGRFLRAAPYLTLTVFLVPVAAGLTGAVLPAFGILPALGGTAITADPFRAFAAYPGAADAVWRTVWTGLAATAISVATVILFAAFWRGTRLFRVLQRLISPLLSVPHSAVALGLLFLLAPSGWLVRAISPWPSGFDRPPDIALAPDPLGLAFILALVVKEVPFLFLMLLAALDQVPERETMALARSLGYGQATGWLKTVFPRIYGHLRLPIYAVLAYSLSVIDMALILLPSPSPTLAVLILRWFNDPDLTQQFTAAAGSVVQLAVVVAGIGLWRSGEVAVARLFRPALSDGRRGASEGVPLRGAALAPVLIVFAVGALSIAGMALWSLARRWRFPDVLPSAWTSANWLERAGPLADPAWVTLATGLAAAAIALFLVLSCFENERRHGLHPGAGALWLIYIPLLVPQIAFLFGAQIVLVAAGADGSWGAMIWAHLLFVLPYMYLSLREAFRRFDDRYRIAALCLGKDPGVVFRRVTLPMLLRPILVALAVGFAVSVAQYLPTIFAGAGRFATLTTEAVTLAGNGDRRVIGLYVVAQSALPFVGFLLASAIPAWLYRDRRGMRGIG